MENAMQKMFYQAINVSQDLLNDYVDKPKVVGPYLGDKQKIAIMQIIAMVKGETVAEIRFPNDWWEAFKERWYPKWLLKHFPVRYYCWQIDRHYPPNFPNGIIRTYNSNSRGYLK